ncbi:MAG: phosphotransferase family protein [Actinomycetota bacterium]|nr:phosphotransferase family protein [Actinomycetota bacterium]
MEDDKGEEISSAAARPDESRRDPERTRIDIEAWLTTKLGASAEPVVSDVTVPESNGMSSETVLVDASWVTDGERVEHPLVFRIAPDAAAVPVFQTYDFDSQFRVMAKVGELSDVPVPDVYWLEEDAAPIGAPFFVMSRITGVVPPDVLPYDFGDNWLFDASLEDQRRLEETSVDALARLHAIADPVTNFDFLASDAEGDTPLRRHVADLRSYYEWVSSDGNRSPLIERCFDWMDEHWPDDEGETVLSWGDARIGNAMYRDFEPVAVLDWEMAGLAPREVDLAWMIFIHRFFEDIAVSMGLDGMPHFMHRDRIVELYEERSGHAPHDMDFFTMYAALRHAVVMSQVQRRAIRFGVAEMPEDIDDLIMHRATLEEMMAGEYWSRVL